MLLLLSPFSRVRLCDPIDGSPPGSPIHGILQARTLEWVSQVFINHCFPGGSDGKESACNARDLSLIPGSGRSPGEGNGNPFHIIAREIPWTEWFGGLQSTGGKRVRHNLATEHIKSVQIKKCLIFKFKFIHFYLLSSNTSIDYHPKIPPALTVAKRHGLITV